ncbi:MAG: hypothetical protein B7X90_17760 [Novosphingobium sp. 17-62-19]|uniref:DNA-binding domain-containing protein n=1 Tax=Novosphingobium sp. 17-62-19 TaxID=1970406 RepID=UPI000BD311CE|nr:DNA-binding domain-containing protein [Novosphingobium sp. 17-62-19]OZA16595.1 MAG: hypothetical protein B7X90_17760 [Novosphingobium sp. 17-62-19]HQS97923.1 DNA-binding domain-containing protein [Novosphingobium sp.]
MSAAQVIYPEQFSAQSAPKEWFSAADLADLRLPGLPAETRSVQRRAVDERWGERRAIDGTLLARPRAGRRGGGLEFHLQVLPIAARQELVRRGISAETAEDAAAMSEAEALWDWFGQQPDKVRVEAQKRLDAVAEVHLLHGQMKVAKNIAVREVAAKHSVSQATLWNWNKAVSGVERKDWLPALAPRRKGGGKAADIPDELWQLFKSDWLRLSAPPMAASYHTVKKRAKALGLTLPSVPAASTLSAPLACASSCRSVSPNMLSTNFCDMMLT